jgi:hypothetical protein
MSALKNIAVMLLLTAAILPAAAPAYETPSGKACTGEDWRRQFLKGLRPGEEECQVLDLNGKALQSQPPAVESNPQQVSGAQVMADLDHDFAQMFTLVLYLAEAVIAGCLIWALFDMRRQLRMQTELLETHTRLLAAMANVADPVRN